MAPLLISNDVSAIFKILMLERGLGYFFGGVLATCLMDSLFAGRPGCIDSHPDVVDGLSFFPFRNEGKEKGNETLLHYQLVGEGWLLLSHGCHHLAQVSRCLAGTKEGDVASQGFHLIYIYR